MGGIVKSLRAFVIPDLPAEIRDDYLVHAANELQRHAPWLFGAMFVTSLIAMLAASPGAHWVVAYGLPGVMAAYCLLSIVGLRTSWQIEGKPWRAEKFLFSASISSCFGATVCSVWCVLSWLSAPEGMRMHFPIIVVMGSLATAYCLAAVRTGAVANLVIDLVPIIALMALSGNIEEIAAAASLTLVGLFQLTVLDTQRQRVVSLLQLQHDTRRLARTDPLTGLYNRRALLDEARRLAQPGEPMRLVLVDVDHFKAINDGFGHDTGDRVLRELARLLARHGSDRIAVARIGGEEFALVGRAQDLAPGVPWAILTEIRAATFVPGRTVTASIGVAECQPGDRYWWEQLFAGADRALYQAKTEGRNRLCHGEPARPREGVAEAA